MELFSIRIQRTFQLVSTVYIVCIEYFFASAFQNMALTAQLTVVQTSPFIQNVIQTFLSCR